MVRGRAIGGSRRRGGLLVGVLVTVLAAGACTSANEDRVVTVTVNPGQQTSSQVTVPPQTGTAGTGDGGGAAATTGSSDPSTGSTNNGVRVTSKPRFGTKNIAPNEPVVITVFSGQIQKLQLIGDDGSRVDGKISADKATWTSTDRMDYGITYTADGVAKAVLNGAAVPISGTISTVTPKKTMGIQINIPDGGTVGIAAPIIVTFLGQVADKAAAEAALKVTTSAGDAVQGNWAWVQDEDFQRLGYKQSQAHWRPTKSPESPTPYWPAGTKVTLQADLRGVDYGGGVWGREDVVSRFSIRPDAQIVKADAASHRLVITVDDKVVKNYAVSYGKESIPGRGTLNGIHVVTNKYPEYAMCNPQFDYCNAKEKWAVRINNNGEFIHENLKAQAAFGIANVSHGCVNMGEPDAKQYYDSAMYGDPVEVTNTGGPAMSEADALYDWIYTPDEWKALSKLG
ncbi:L,D-transpeptidase [Nakamurella endophytica]|uniref:L,D-transpeptidase n=1 Tax=Nakamurella endophytica TaxID=1748367 RepID=A0A917T9E9_9ACTN|nr:Ig-like domain-containing protein [Nakamurella endophytica]GGM15307.1 L,D-transpeptidase [Nakamurella endophytica]